MCSTGRQIYSVSNRSYCRIGRIRKNYSSTEGINRSMGPWYSITSCY